MESELPREQIENLEQQLSVADATLARLRSQQNLLKARLQAAEARRQLEGGLPQPKRRRWLVPMAIGAGLIALVSLLLILPKVSKPPDQPVVVERPEPVTPGQIDDAMVTEGVGWGGFRVARHAKNWSGLSVPRIQTPIHRSSGFPGDRSTMSIA